MKNKRLTLALTIVNISILLIVLFLFTSAFKPEVAPVIRGHAFELIDDQGKVRAEIKILPPDPSVKMPDGTTGSPETVILRLIDSKGGPNVKIAATEDGSGLVLGGESGYVQILSRTAVPTVKLTDKKGNEKLIGVK
jgi:hypothetical protein